MLALFLLAALALPFLKSHITSVSMIVCGDPFTTSFAAASSLPIHIVKCNIMMADVAIPIVKWHIMMADVAIHIVKCNIMMADVAIHIVK